MCSCLNELVHVWSQMELMDVQLLNELMHVWSQME